MKAPLVALFVTVVLVAAADVTAATRPTLRPVASAPLTIRGRGFVPGERVTLTVSAGSRRTLKVVAGSAGGFRAVFSFTRPRCTAWLVSAIGSKGSRAAYRPPPAACDPPVAAGTSPPAQGSGVAGSVRRGPLTPVCTAEQPCDGPAAGVAVELLQRGAVIAQTTTGPDGQYYVLAAPGDYVVRAAGRNLEPQPAHVETGSFTEVDFLIDTGIR